MKRATILVLSLALPVSAIAADEQLPAVARVEDHSNLAANTWTLIHVEDNSGGKWGARVIYAPNVDRLYLWGFGGKQPDRNRYLRYELESFAPLDATWIEALPAAKADVWGDGEHPPFVIYGQRGPAEGPSFRSVGNQSFNRISFHDFDSVIRPSPLLIFNQICYDSKRDRAVLFAGGHTFALDPATNTWADLVPTNSPTACQQLAWASLAYDPVNDELLLFGGGDALNLDGGAHTWLYSCETNTWRRAGLGIEPPLRCTSPIVYDSATEMLVMFGGYNQQAALNDTWVYHCQDRRWELRKPDPSPPPMFAPAAAAIPGGGKVLVIGTDATTSKRTHSATRAATETWIYDVKKNAWTPVGKTLDLLRYTWLTAAGGGKHGLVFLVAFGQQRRTYAFRYDPLEEQAEHAGHPPGVVRWKYPDQRDSLAQAPLSDAAAHKQLLDSLPANQFVDVEYPGSLVSKTWSTGIATTTGQIIYHGGGHSGYSGNDWAQYDVATNRWSIAVDPCFPPYLEASNGSPWGYSYGCRPWSQHTYLWYAYDPVSKMVVYCARPTIHDGVELALDPDDPDKTSIYDTKKHGYWTWLYDPAKKQMCGPIFGRPFRQSWGLALCTTPGGVYATTGGTAPHLYKAMVAGADVRWELVDESFPKTAPTGRYNYEFLPIVYDSKRDRLIHTMGGGDEGKPPWFQMHARGLGKDEKWERIDFKGITPLPAREIVYLPKQDALLALLDRDNVYVFHCETNEWKHLDVALPQGSYTHECSLDYDPIHDVVVALIPEGFSRRLRTLLFRYDPKTAKYRADA